MAQNLNVNTNIKKMAQNVSVNTNIKKMAQNVISSQVRVISE